MAQGRKTSAILLSAAIFILLEVAALAMLRSSSTLHDLALGRASRRVQAALWGGGETVRNHFRLQRQNDSLAMDNARLHEELQTYRLRDEQTREEAASVSGQGRQFRYIPATVVKMSRGTAHNYIILNKGSEDGVVAQSGIITERGVVGIISSVGKHYSYGLTLMNGNVTVSAKIGSSGINAPLRWDGLSSSGARLSDIPPHHNIAPGDTVRTSGFSSIFPADIPIGVSTGTRLVDGSTVSVDVELFQDFSNVHYVTIVENRDKAEIEALEKAEEKR